LQLQVEAMEISAQLQGLGNGGDATEAIAEAVASKSTELNEEHRRRSEEIAEAFEAQLAAQRCDMEAQLAALVSERDGLDAEKEGWKAERDILGAEKEGWETERQGWEAEKIQLQQALAALEAATIAGPVEYKVGDKVEYHSSSQDCWVDATVIQKHSNGTYDLDCKDEVKPERMRARGAGAAEEDEEPEEAAEEAPKKQGKKKVVRARSKAPSGQGSQGRSAGRSSASKEPEEEEEGKRKEEEQEESCKENEPDAPAKEPTKVEVPKQKKPEGAKSRGRKFAQQAALNQNRTGPGAVKLSPKVIRAMESVSLASPSMSVEPIQEPEDATMNSAEAPKTRRSARNRS